jgi:hypothetical protein
MRPSICYSRYTRHMSTGYRFRAYPDDKVARVLARWIGCQRFIKNAKVREDRYYRAFQRRFAAFAGQHAPVDQTYSHLIGDRAGRVPRAPHVTERRKATAMKTKTAATERPPAPAKFPLLPPQRLIAWRRGLALAGCTAAMLLGGCASAPPPAPELVGISNTGANQDAWPDPIVFSWRTAGRNGAPPLGAADRQSPPLAFKSEATPAVAASLAREMARAGANVVPVGTPNAIEVDVKLQAWLMPAGGIGRTRADIQVAQSIEQVLSAAAQEGASGAVDAPGRRVAVTLPLGGWKTPIGETGLSVGLAGFLFHNLGDLTGARQAFNSFFGADATGTVCLFPAKGCARRKGPQQDFELTGTYTVDGQQRTITAALLLVQPKPNILQPLAYAMADWRAAALGQRTPNCQFWKTGDRTADCEPVPSPLAPKDLW